MLKTEKETKVAKRLAEFKYWIRKYKAKATRRGVAISFIDNAAEILNDVYWTLVENYVRPMVNAREEANGNGESNISRFKIISTTELTVMKVSPVKAEDDEIERLQNAHFAYYVAVTILKSYNKKISSNSFRVIDGYKETFENIKPELILSVQQEHLKWLAYLDTRSTLPMISNAQTWRLFNLCLLAMENKLPHETKTTPKKKRRT